MNVLETEGLTRRFGNLIAVASPMFPWHTGGSDMPRVHSPIALLLAMLAAMAVGSRGRAMLTLHDHRDPVLVIDAAKTSGVKHSADLSPEMQWPTESWVEASERS